MKPEGKQAVLAPHTTHHVNGTGHGKAMTTRAVAAALSDSFKGIVPFAVFSKAFNTASNSIDLSAFGTGMYSVKITTDKNVTVKKVMVTK